MMNCMAMPEVISLCGQHVQLEPLRTSLVDELLAAATQDRSSYTWTAVPDSAAGIRTYVDTLLADQRAGLVVPFAQRRVADGQVVGCTRFMRIERWSGATTPDEVEIGGTWLAASAQRSAINTEAKLLLLDFAFDAWNVHRVAICTDARNERSRVAITRLGATFEGVLRNHRASYVSGESGVPRDSALYSITRADWPAIRARLKERLT